MRVRRSDHAETVGVGAEILLKRETVLQGGPGILVLKHPGFLGHRTVEVRLVPDLEVGERVIGRQHRVRLARAFGLCHFIDRFPPRTRLGIVGIESATELFIHWKHQPIREVAVVGIAKTEPLVFSS
jgi:hypothetical protein